MDNTTGRAVSAVELLVAVQCLRLAGAHTSKFAPPPGQRDACQVTPHGGGWEVTFGPALTGPRGWYATIEDAAEAVVLHRHTRRRVR